MRLLSYALIVLLFVSLFAGFIPLSPTQAQGQEIDIFKDNFEGYAVGTFPSAGGWILVWGGKGTQYQIITDSRYRSPIKSFQLWGTYEWSCVVERHFSTDASVIGFEAYVMVEDYHSNEFSATVAFWNREKATWGKYYATIEFTSDRYIQARGLIDTKKLQTYVPYTWYKIKLVLDRSTNTFSVWINDELKASGIKTADTYEIDALQLASRWGGVQCYYDDVRVFTIQTQPQQYYLKVRLDAATLNGQPLSTSNAEIKVSPGASVKGTVSFIVENVQPGSWITPVIWVTSWERGSEADGKVRVVDYDIRSTTHFSVSINVIAPSSVGTYYIGFFAGWMNNPDEVASNDHPPQYGDGDDVWDIPPQGWEEVIANGQASTGPYHMPGRAIRLIVQRAEDWTTTTTVTVTATPLPVTVTETKTVTATVTQTTTLTQPITITETRTVTTTITAAPTPVTITTTKTETVTTTVTPPPVTTTVTQLVTTAETTTVTQPVTVTTTTTVAPGAPYTTTVTTTTTEVRTETVTEARTTVTTTRTIVENTWLEPPVALITSLGMFFVSLLAAAFIARRRP